MDMAELKSYMIGARYRHFKGDVYVVTDIAVDSETNEVMVVYKEFLNPLRVWVRPLAMFISEVDHTKYPNVTQKYRFERLNKNG